MFSLPENPPILAEGDKNTLAHVLWIQRHMAHIEQIQWWIRQIGGGGNQGVYAYNPLYGDVAKVKENAIPDMSVVINPFAGFYSLSPFRVPDELVTEPLVAPISDIRIDRVVANGPTTSFKIYLGAEAASPVAPAAQDGDVTLAYIHHRIGETKILTDDFTGNTDGWVEDARVFMNM